MTGEIMARSGLVAFGQFEGVVYRVTYTWRGDAIRIISAQKANRRRPRAVLQNGILVQDIDEMLGRGDVRPTRDDAPEAEAEGAEFWARAVVIQPRDRKASVHLRIDPDVLAWFREQGGGHRRG